MMRKRMLVALLTLSSCGGPNWPDEQFPRDAKVARVLFAEGGGVLRETCEAIVVELTDRAATRLIGRAERRDGKLLIVPPDGWLSSPAPDPVGPHTYFEGAFGGCNNEGKHPLGDLDGALERPSAFYKVINQVRASPSSCRERSWQASSTSVEADRYVCFPPKPAVTALDPFLPLGERRRHIPLLRGLRWAIYA